MSDERAILIVEDDEWWQAVLKESLEDEGYTVTTLAGYQDVRQALEERAFGLVILDLLLDESAPMLDGERLLAHISRHYSKTPCIIVSGHGDIRVVRDAFKQYHVIDFIAKDQFDIPTFIELVGTVLQSSTDPAILRRTLRQTLETKFDQEEIQDLCFDMGIDFQDLPSEGKKAREVVAYCQRHDRLKELTANIIRLRPGSL
ncbi:MAG: response regulator [Chloroflexi bacterium]|nr:response regulator [Chloroflexota bacterium]